MLNPGAVVSHYRLVRRLGAGGMGEVYLAQDTTLDRPVAIKFLIAPDDEQGRQRLLREARAVASLDHPAICAVYEVGSDPAGGDFIVMQYIEGESLSARLRRGPLPPDEALRIAGHIAEALRAAHLRGIVHRDLKPQNVILTPSGAPKLLDFGLARHLASGDVAAEALTVEPLTRPHAVIGTPGYMAPEQVRGQPADARSDVFALGCVLYACLTGRHAFTGVTASEIHGQVLHVDPPAPSTVVPELGPAFDALCSRLLQKAPVDRLQSAEEAIGAFHALMGASRASEGGITTVGAATVSSFFGRRGLVAVIAIAIIGAVGMWATWHWRRSASVPPPPAEAMRWYLSGVEALREGTYAGARASLQEAVRVHKPFVQAYARLAEAQSELDEQGNAQQSLLLASDLMPAGAQLDTDDQLRLEAARAAVLRKYDQAINTYRRIAERHPRDAGAWLDVARLEEAAERRKEARADCETALKLDAQYAAAHLRFGVLQSFAGQTPAAMASFDESIRLYRVAARPEGEAEALLRKGAAQSATSQLSQARASLEQAIAVAADPRFISQRLRARFELARVTLYEGKFAEAETQARDAVEQATAASLQTLAANGLIELAVVLQGQRQLDKAEAALARSIELATTHGAVRTEMRAKLQLAGLKNESHEPREAIALADGPIRFFSSGNSIRQEAQGKNIVSRANESLDNYAEASRLATEALHLGESIDDDGLIATSLESLVGQLTNLGRLPEALAHRERIEQIYRQKTPALLAYDLPNHADLLIQMGRGKEAEKHLAEIDRYLAEGVEAFKGRDRRVAVLRAFRASTELRFADVERLANGALGPSRAKADSTSLLAKVLAEHARAQLGRSRAAPADIAGWPAEAASPASQRELSYWAASTLLARHEDTSAYSVASEALRALEGRENPELGWRLAAIAGLAKQTGTAAQSGASMRDHARADIQRLVSLWGAQADVYFDRPDLKALRQRIQ